MPPKNSKKPKLRLVSPGPAPPRNSFTNTDYYRKTREEIHSPISRIHSLSPDSPYSDQPHSSPPHLTHIHEGTEPDIDEREADEKGEGRQRTVVFNWQVFTALFRRWRRQKDRDTRSKAAGQRL